MKKILVVDDDDATRQLLREVFEKQDYEVTLACSGEEARKLLGADAFEVILSDIRMLELDGVGLLTHIKERGIPSVVILMTAMGIYGF